jgi:acetyltransferase
MLGLGGIFAEALKDFTIRLAPLAPEDAFEMADALRSRALMGPYRGMEAVDRDALALLLVRLSELALDFPCIKEIDLNPVIIAHGMPCAADALMIIDEEGGHG